MKELIAELLTGLGNKVAMIILVGASALTTGTAVSKVVLKQTEAEQKTVEVQQETPEVQKVLVPAATPTVDTTNRCIVTIFSKTYDVSSLRSSHSGGDIFKCGTDMSASYQSKHGTGVSRLAKYAYDPANPGATPTITAGTTGTGKSQDDDDEIEEREDKRNEDRYQDEDDD